jgi:hypothetical protein
VGDDVEGFDGDEFVDRVVERGDSDPDEEAADAVHPPGR